jgi:hypothetical protein
MLREAGEPTTAIDEEAETALTERMLARLNRARAWRTRRSWCSITGSLTPRTFPKFKPKTRSTSRNVATESRLRPTARYAYGQGATMRIEFRHHATRHRWSFDCGQQSVTIIPYHHRRNGAIPARKERRTPCRTRQSSRFHCRDQAVMCSPFQMVVLPALSPSPPDVGGNGRPRRGLRSGAATLSVTQRSSPECPPRRTL